MAVFAHTSTFVCHPKDNLLALPWQSHIVKYPAVGAYSRFQHKVNNIMAKVRFCAIILHRILVENTLVFH